MLKGLRIVPEDDSGESFAIQDQDGNFIGDASNLADAIAQAKQFAELHEVEFVKVYFSPQ